VKSNFVEPWRRFGKLEQARFALTLHKVWRVESNFVEPWRRFGKLEQARFALTLHKV